MSRRALDEMDRAWEGERGLTILELLVVVGLVGILAKIATAQYDRFAGRARQSEAKLALSSIYLLEKTAAAELNSYTACIGSLGYAPQSGTRYYTVGFKFSSALYSFACGPQGDTLCVQKAFGEGNVTMQLVISGVNHFFNNVTLCSLVIPTFGSATVGDLQTAATARVNAATTMYAAFPTVDSDMPDTVLSQNAFIAGAVGNISSANKLDIWQINQDKALTQVSSGL